MLTQEARAQRLVACLLAGPPRGSGMCWKARNHSGDPCFLALLHKGDTEGGAALVLCLSPPAPGTLWGTWPLPTPGPGHSDMPSPGPSAWLVLVQFPGVWVWTRWLAGTHHPHGQPGGPLIRRDGCQSHGMPLIKQTSISRWPGGGGKRPSSGDAHISGGNTEAAGSGLGPPPHTTVLPASSPHQRLLTV